MEVRICLTWSLQQANKNSDSKIRVYGFVERQLPIQFCRTASCSEFIMWKFIFGTLDLVCFLSTFRSPSFFLLTLFSIVFSLLFPLKPKPNFSHTRNKVSLYGALNNPSHCANVISALPKSEEWNSSKILRLHLSVINAFSAAGIVYGIESLQYFPIFSNMPLHLP
jgi:hypothetical protein